MRTRSTTRRSSTSQRRKLVWARSFSTGPQSLAQGATLAFNLLQQFEVALGAGLLGCTIMRVRGTVMMANQTAGGNDASMALGLLVGTDDMTIAQLDPIARSQDDWMYWDTLIAHQVASTEFQGVDNYKVDVRAKRKCEELGDTLWLGVRNYNSAAVGQRFNYSMSVLLALP